MTIKGFFAGYKNGVVDLFTGIYYAIDTNQVATKTDTIYGTNTSRASIREAIEQDTANVPDNLLPLFAGVDNLDGNIIDYDTNTNIGKWEL